MQKIYLAIKLLASFGILLAVYLLLEQINGSSFRPCNINSFINCNAIIDGAVSKTFGIPTPLIGLVGYIVILISAILEKKKVILGMATFGLVFCLWIAYRELFKLHVLCPVCILCQVDMISVFILGIVIQKLKSM